MRLPVIAFVLSLTASSALAGSDELFLKGAIYPEAQIYAAKVTEAYKFINAGQLEASLTAFIEADSMPVFEAPRYEQLPQIAYLQHRLGKTRAAQQTLQLAILADAIEQGKIACPDDSKPGGVIQANYPLAMRKDAGGRMCSAVFSLGHPDPEYLAKVAVLKAMIRN